jgi:GxxExxY protein
VHTALGHGFLEAVYRRAIAAELRQRGLHVETEVPFAIQFAGATVGEYRADLVVERKIVVECKVAEFLTAVHEAQLINYLRASGLELGLLLNFGSRATFRRLVCSSKERPLQSPRASA